MGKKISVFLWAIFGSLLLLLTIIPTTSNFAQAQENNFTDGEVIFNRTLTSDTFQKSDGSFRKVYYPSANNFPDENGELKPFEDVVDISFNQGKLVYSWHDKEFKLKPIIIYNGNPYTLSDIRKFYPNINLEAFISKERGNYKWSFNITRIPDNIKDNIDYIAFQLTDAQNLSWSDVRKSGHNLYFPDNVKIDYSDLARSGFTLNVVNKTYLLIGNVSGQNNLWLDPTVTYDFNDTNQGNIIFAEEGLDSNENDPSPPSNGPRYTLTGSSLTDVSSSSGLDTHDSVYETVNLGSSDVGWHTFYSNFSHDVDSNDIISINWTYVGNCAGSCGTEEIYIYIWNDTGSDWVQCGDPIDSTVDDERECIVDSNVQDFINDTGFTHMIAHMDTGNSETIGSDYVSLEIEYIPQVNVTLTSPIDSASSNALDNYFVCESEVSSGDTLNSVNFTFYNNDGTINGSNFTAITGTTNLTNVSYNFGADGTFKWNCLTNSSSGSEAYAQSNFTFTISTDAPAITLNYPSNNTFFNNESDIYLNYTATDTNGIKHCETWNDFSGTFQLEFNNSNISSGLQNFSTHSATSDGEYLWNVFCEDTTSTGTFATNNLSFTVDTVYPEISSINLTTAEGSQTIKFNSSISDANLNNCFYMVLNESNSTDVGNTTFTCGNQDVQTVLSDFGSYNLYVYGNDSAGNVNNTIKSFSISDTASSITVTGGGGGATSDLAPIIALKEPSQGNFTFTISRSFSDLERAILYSRLNSYCGEIINSQSLSIVDNSQSCFLTDFQLDKFGQILSVEDDISLTADELRAWYFQYKEQQIENIQLSQGNVQEYDLVQAVVGILEPLRINPPRIDTPFIINQESGNKSISYVLTSNKGIKSCEVISNTPNFNCTLISADAIEVSYLIEDTSFFSNVYQGKVSILTDAEPEKQESAPITIIFRVYNVANIPLIYILFAFISLGAGGIFLFRNKKVRKNAKSFTKDVLN
jgi:hypothetical protein